MRTFIRTAPKDRRIYISLVHTGLRHTFGIARFLQIGFQNSHSPKILQGDFIYVRKRKNLPASASQR